MRVRSSNLPVELYSMVIIINADVIEEATPSDLKIDNGFEQPVRFDVAYPKLKLIFEYHGQQHYHDSHFGELKNFQRRDEIKKKLCAKNGFTLINVPYWWDYQIESLLNSIHLERPDLVKQLVGKGHPIPVTQPQRQKRTR